RRPAARAGAWTPWAAACAAAARSLLPTVVTQPAGSISRGGSARQSPRMQFPRVLYTPLRIYVSRNIKSVERPAEKLSQINFWLIETLVALTGIEPVFRP